MHRYSHLLSGVASGLECASCLQVDDIRQPIDLDLLLTEAVAFFERIGEKPKRVVYALSGESKHRRSSLQSFLKKFQGNCHSVGTTFQSLTITSVGFEGDAISETWTPRAVISVARHGRILEAFFQSSRKLEDERKFFPKMPFYIAPDDFSAAYIFEFPFVFSPLAYASGLSFSPNVKKWGELNDRDATRVANWSNHCYRGNRGSDGYLRDVYHINLIGPEHFKVRVGQLGLIDWIRHNPERGFLTPFKHKIIWEIDSVNISSVQRQLEHAKILLSGYPPE